MNKDYLDLVKFWDSNFVLSKEDEKKLLSEIDPLDDISLAPSKKLYDILASFNGLHHILDYGCGSGWASIIIAKNHARKVTAVDVSNNAIKMTDFYKKAFEVDEKINTLKIDENYLKLLDNEVFDGFYSSNVIDVIPLEMAKEIIKESARIITKNGKAIYSLNYYIDPLKMKSRGHQVNDKSIYIDGVLRLTSLTDEEWSVIFNEYFIIESLSYFSWPGEEKETRRIFVLKPR